MILKDQIRVLELLPHSGQYDAPVHCNIRVATLSDNPQYETLSYVWGDPDSQAHINVSGSYRKVTTNLHKTLLRLRLAAETRCLWVDQLCINQWDRKEKAEQVQLMRSIYTTCTGCILWIGEVPSSISTVDAQGAWDILLYMAATQRASNEERNNVPTPPALASEAAFEAANKALHTVGTDANPWWHRIWTVQEAVLPPKSTLMWGPLSMPWQTLLDASSAWTNPQGPPQALYKLIKPGNYTVSDIACHTIWIEIAKDRTDCPLFVVHRWRHRLAMDSRDKIYALLGLVAPGALPATESCNYEISSVEVYCALTLDLILDEGDLRPLVADPRIEADQATPEIPGWALDLKAKGRLNTDWYHLYGWSVYDAANGASLDTDNFLAELGAVLEERALTLRGLYVDTIKLVAKPIEKQNRGEGSKGRLQEALGTWKALSEKDFASRKADSSAEVSPYYKGSGTDNDEAFARLMLGNLMRNAEQWPVRWATKEDADEVLEFLEKGSVGAEVYQTMSGMTLNQTFFITEAGWMGVGNLDAHPGDEVWVFDGGRVPFIVRPRATSEAGHFDFVGQCNIQGIMSGELLKNVGKEPEKNSIRVY